LSWGEAISLKIRPLPIMLLLEKLLVQLLGLALYRLSETGFTAAPPSILIGGDLPRGGNNWVVFMMFTLETSLTPSENPAFTVL
jgi:hypothetical protein